MAGTVRNRCVREWRVCGMVCGCRSLAGVWSYLSGQVAEIQGHAEAMTGSSHVRDLNTDVTCLITTWPAPALSL